MIKGILADKEKLKLLLSYHVAPGSALTADGLKALVPAKGAYTLKTAAKGETIAVTLGKDDAVHVNGGRHALG